MTIGKNLKTGSLIYPLNQWEVELK